MRWSNTVIALIKIWNTNTNRLEFITKTNYHFIPTADNSHLDVSKSIISCIICVEKKDCYNYSGSPMKPLSSRGSISNLQRRKCSDNQNMLKDILIKGQMWKIFTVMNHKMTTMHHQRSRKRVRLGYLPHECCSYGVLWNFHSGPEWLFYICIMFHVMSKWLFRSCKKSLVTW